jgi:prepilin-type N-terminal cleavage/methylation domain-containing protein
MGVLSTKLKSGAGFTPHITKDYVRGFTLIELLVVCGIIVLLSAMVFLNYRGGEREFALLGATHKLAQDIRRTQEMAMSSKELLSGQIPPGGYGVVFEKYTEAGLTNYNIYIYADLNGNEKYTSGEEIETIYKKSDGIYLEKEVKIKEVRVGGSTFDKISINFKPPDPTIKIFESGGGTPYSLITITLAQEGDESKTKIITVNPVGLIDID